jgi:predicted DNA-binding antitoxin AbrB/MazE fold protein
MYTVNAIYDGNYFKLKEPVPVNEKYEVVITFTNPIKKQQDKILQYFNIWNEDDVNCVKEIINERDNFSLSRPEI